VSSRSVLRSVLLASTSSVLIGGGSAPFVAVNGDPIAATVMGIATTDSNTTPDMQGKVVAVRFKGMGRRHPRTGPVFNPAGCSITVQSPGFNSSGGAINVTRVIPFRAALFNPYPRVWQALTAVPARSYRANGDLVFYTEAGGTTSSTAPLVSGVDGTVTWVAIPSLFVATEVSRLEALAGADVDVYIVLGDYIFAGDTIVSVTMAANAYNDGTTASRARTITDGGVMSNTSTLEPDLAAVLEVTRPHRRAIGSISHAVFAQHPRGIACVQMQAFRADGTQPSPLYTITAPTLNAKAATSGLRYSEYRQTIDTTGIFATGGDPTDGYIVVDVFPKMGLAYRASIHGDGAQWLGSTAVYDRQVVRNGVNLYICVTPGTTASSGGPTGTGTSIADGSAVWNYYGNNLIRVAGPNVQALHHFVSDPNDRQIIGFACVAPTGAAAPIASNVYATQAAAEAAFALNDYYATALAAGTALVTYNNTPQAGKVVHADAGGGTIILMNGTHISLGGDMNAGVASGKEWLNIIGKGPGVTTYSGPTNGTTANNLNSARTRYSDLLMDDSGASIVPRGVDTANTVQGVTELWLDGFTATCVAAGRAVLQNVYAGWVENGTFNATAAGTWSLRNGVTSSAGQMAIGCVGNVATSLFASAGSFNMANQHISIVDQDLASLPRARNQFTVDASNWLRSSSTLVNCFRRLNFASSPIPRYGSVIVNNLAESITATGGNCYSVAADASIGNLTGYVLMAHNTGAGERCNILYNDQLLFPLRPKAYFFANLTRSFANVGSWADHSGSPRAAIRDNGVIAAKYQIASRDNVSATKGGSTGGLTVPQDLGSLGALAIGDNVSWGPYNFVDADQRFEFVNDQSGNVSGSGGTIADYAIVSTAFSYRRVAVSLEPWDIRGVVRPTSPLADTGAVQA